jgi:zinc/manganese transport system ATP-binding protein/zinc transport system ATP-binding protein
MESLIKVKDLSIGYKSPLQTNLSFDLNEGEILFIRGRNGSGKSTLIKTLCGSLRTLGGSISWSVGPKKISLLPQVVSHELPLSITLGEILNLFNEDQKIKDLLASNLHTRRFIDASGGEKQKTIILSRINQDTDVLILDEPFNHLDQKASKEMMSFISSLIQSKVIKGVILISHIDIDFDELKVKEVQLL